MKGWAVIVGILILGMVISIGCTSKTTTEQIPMQTIPPTTLAPVVVETPVIETTIPTVSPTAPQTPMGTVIIMLPPIGSEKFAEARHAIISIDGVAVGTGSSSVPFSIKLAEGVHIISVQGFVDREVTVQFAKTTTIDVRDNDNPIIAPLILREFGFYEVHNGMKSYVSPYAYGKVKSNVNRPIKINVTVEFYDRSVVKLGEGYDSVSVDPFGTSNFEAVAFGVKAPAEFYCRYSGIII